MHDDFKEHFLIAYTSTLTFAEQDVKEFTKACILLQKIPDDFLVFIGGYMLGAGYHMPEDDGEDVLLSILEEFYIRTYGGV